jgi:hypothetical protein
MAINRKNINKLKAQFFRCRANRSEQINAAVEILGELINNSNYNYIHNQLSKVGIKTIKLSPKEARNTSLPKEVFRAVKNTSLLSLSPPRKHDEILKFQELIHLWNKINKISGKILEEAKMT